MASKPPDVSTIYPQFAIAVPAVNDAFLEGRVAVLLACIERALHLSAAPAVLLMIFLNLRWAGDPKDWPSDWSAGNVGTVPDYAIMEDRWYGSLSNRAAPKALGLDADWAVRTVKATGNYAEIYERNLGTDSKLGIPRGLNQLWSMGGILYAPPLR